MFSLKARYEKNNSTIHCKNIEYQLGVYQRDIEWEKTTFLVSSQAPGRSHPINPRRVDGSPTRNSATDHQQHDGEETMKSKCSNSKSDLQKP